MKPAEYLNQSIEVITSGFRAKKLDAAVIWEPTASRLVHEKLPARSRPAHRSTRATAAFLVMPQALIEQRPDVVKAWLQAELDAEHVLRRSKERDGDRQNGGSQTTGFPEKALWASAFGSNGEGSEGGTDVRINLAYGFTPEAMDLIKKASTFLVEIKSIPAEIRPEAVLPQLTADILKARDA